jgi:hypothetical protein
MKGAVMASSETFKKRQKEMARKEKQRKKTARRMERKKEQGKVEGQASDELPTGTESGSPGGPTIL